MAAGPMRRVFFALWPEQAERAALSHAVREAVRVSGGRPVPEDNLHLTLAFLGAVPEERIPALGAIARRAAAAYPCEATPLALTLQGLSHFSNSRVLAVLASEEAGDPSSGGGVQALARLLSSETAAAGFDPDLKPFRAHVTVARKVAPALHASAMRPVAWSFAAFALIESRTLAAGPAYSIVESFVLGSAEKVRTEK